MRISRTAVFWIVAVAFVVFLAYSSVKPQQLTCEVCMAFDGGDRCAKASGPTRETATETATTTACGVLARGMDGTIACGRTPPRSVTCTGG